MREAREMREAHETAVSDAHTPGRGRERVERVESDVGSARARGAHPLDAGVVGLHVAPRRHRGETCLHGLSRLGRFH